MSFDPFKELGDPIWVPKQLCHELGASAAVIFAVGQDLARGGHDPTVEMIAETLRMNRSRVNTRLRSLQEAGFLTIDKSEGSTTRLTFHDDPAWGDPPQGKGTDPRDLEQVTP